MLTGEYKLRNTHTNTHTHWRAMAQLGWGKFRIGVKKKRIFSPCDLHSMIACQARMYRCFTVHAFDSQHEICKHETTQTGTKRPSIPQGTVSTGRLSDLQAVHTEVVPTSACQQKNVEVQPPFHIHTALRQTAIPHIHLIPRKRAAAVRERSAAHLQQLPGRCVHDVNRVKSDT